MRKPKLPPKKPNIGLFKSDIQELLRYMNDKDVTLFIKDMNNRYLHWDEFVYRTPPKGFSRKHIWSLMKFNRKSTAKKIVIGSKKKFEFIFNITDIMQQELHEFDMNLGGSLKLSKNIPSEERDRYLISSIMEEAIASSQLEGAATTRRVAKEMLRSSRKPRNKSEQMVMNNYLTAKMIKDSNTSKLSADFILKVHKSITKDTLDDKEDEGVFRNTNDVTVRDRATGEVNHYPPDFNLIPELIKSLCSFVNNSKMYFIHPIIKASILHFLIGYIHPFADGNGRTARSLFYWYLVKEGYWVAEFMSISRVIIKSPIKYARAFLYTECDDNDLTYFLNYQLRTIKIALNELKKYLSRKAREQKELFKIIEKIENINVRQADIIHEFYVNEHKNITIKEIQEVYNVVYETARQDLLELEKKGFLTKKTMGKKRLVFFSSRNFESMIKKFIKD